MKAQSFDVLYGARSVAARLARKINADHRHKQKWADDPAYRLAEAAEGGTKYSHKRGVAQPWVPTGVDDDPPPELVKKDCKEWLLEASIRGYGWYPNWEQAARILEYRQQGGN